MRTVKEKYDLDMKFYFKNESLKIVKKGEGGGISWYANSGIISPLFYDNWNFMSILKLVYSNISINTGWQELTKTKVKITTKLHHCNFITSSWEINHRLYWNMLLWFCNKDHSAKWDFLHYML